MLEKIFLGFRGLNPALKTPPYVDAPAYGGPVFGGGSHAPPMNGASFPYRLSIAEWSAGGYEQNVTPPAPPQPGFFEWQISQTTAFTAFRQNSRVALSGKGPYFFEIPATNLVSGTTYYMRSRFVSAAGLISPWSQNWTLKRS